MPAPPSLPDPSQIETRLLIVAEMLERAVAEVRRTMAEIKGGFESDLPPKSDAKGSEIGNA